ncbi:hypothetical protein L208DRAFT_1380693 [Tricholoma matsutake]|nr:hypothetical protein L208DRAFT_1380693 [Tricholoma matsutake 945]
MPTTNQIQSYRDNNLAAVSNGEKVGGEADHLAFKGSWSRFWIDMWLGWALPKAMTWLRENDPKKNGAVHGNADDDGSDDSDSKYPWVLLVHERTKLIKFKKKGLITGDDLYTVKHPRGKHWVNQTVYLASKYVIPESVWQDGNWQTNEPLNTANNGAHSEDLSGFSPPPMSMILDMEPASASTTGKETWQVLTPRVLDEGGANFLLADQIEIAAGEGPGISSAGAIEEDITATKVTKETPEVTNPISSVSTGSTSTLSAMTPSSSTAVSDFALSGAATPSVYIPALPMLLHYPDELCVKLLWEKTSSS